MTKIKSAVERLRLRDRCIWCRRLGWFYEICKIQFFGKTRNWICDWHHLVLSCHDMLLYLLVVRDRFILLWRHFTVYSDLNFMPAVLMIRSLCGCRTSSFSRPHKVAGLLEPIPALSWTKPWTGHTNTVVHDCNKHLVYSTTRKTQLQTVKLNNSFYIFPHKDLL